MTEGVGRCSSSPLWLFDLRYTLRNIHYVGKCMLHSCEPTAFICRWPCSKFKRNCVPIPGIPVGFNLFTSQIIAVFRRSSVLDRTGPLVGRILIHIFPTPFVLVKRSRVGWWNPQSVVLAAMAARVLTQIRLNPFQNSPVFASFWRISSSYIPSWLGELPIFGSPLCCCLAPPAAPARLHRAEAHGARFAGSRTWCGPWRRPCSSGSSAARRRRKERCRRSARPCGRAEVAGRAGFDLGDLIFGSQHGGFNGSTWILHDFTAWNRQKQWFQQQGNRSCGSSKKKWVSSDNTKDFSTKDSRLHHPK